jgi:hypothetical protein
VATVELLLATAEHGRGLQIIDALAENLQIANRREHGAMIRFEKAWYRAGLDTAARKGKHGGPHPRRGY